MSKYIKNEFIIPVKPMLRTPYNITKNNIIPTLLAPMKERRLPHLLNHKLTPGIIIKKATSVALIFFLICYLEYFSISVF